MIKQPETFWDVSSISTRMHFPPSNHATEALYLILGQAADWSIDMLKHKTAVGAFLVMVCSVGSILFFQNIKHTRFFLIVFGSSSTPLRAEAHHIWYRVLDSAQRERKVLEEDYCGNASFETSTEYFNWLATLPNDSDNSRLAIRNNVPNDPMALFDQNLHEGTYKTGTMITDENNFWMIVKNLPSNAPSQVVVLATRNIAPESLRSRLTEVDMNKAIRFVSEKQKGVLRDWAILIRKDGSSVAILHDAIVPLRYIYRNSPFDLTTNLVNGRPVKYLTPTGEVTPKNE